MIEKAPVSRLEVTKFKLNALLEVTQAINENPSQEKLISRYESLLRKELKIGKVILFKFAKTWECILCSGLTSADYQIDVEKDLLHYVGISSISSNQDPSINAFDIVIPVIRDNKHLAIALIGDIDEESEGVSPVIKHLHFIQTLSNIIVVAIENIRLNAENIRQIAIKKELELASRLQAMLIPDPRKLPSEGAVSVSAFYHPHMDVGGDYYDFFELGQDEYGFCICDVSGKGISAALIMSNFQANLRALFDIHIPLDELVSRLNDRVNTSTMGERFLTLFIGKYNVQTRELNYVNAGHNPPLVYNKGTGELIALESHCVGIGMLEEMPPISTRKLLMEKDVKLLCYTDGLVEILLGDLVHEDRGVIEGFLTNGAPIASNIKDIVAHHSILEGNDNIFDDITILGFEFR
jgi:phosphoserine phosphatase RsbU/P